MNKRNVRGVSERPLKITHIWEQCKTIFVRYLTLSTRAERQMELDVLELDLRCYLTLTLVKTYINFMFGLLFFMPGRYVYPTRHEV